MPNLPGTNASYLDWGLLADRPANPGTVPNGLAHYYATDASVLAEWIDGAWVELVASRTRPVPPPPAPGPSLNQWACNVAGWLTYDVCRLLVKKAVDLLPITWIGDVVTGIVSGVLNVLLPESVIADGLIDTIVTTWLSSHISTYLTQFGAAVLDDTLWAKIHCRLYAAIVASPNDLQTAMLAAGTTIAAIGGYVSGVFDGINYLLQHFGIISPTDIPLAAIAASYDCSTCATTGIGPTKPLLQTSFDLTVKDGTTTDTFTDTLTLARGTLSGTAPAITWTPATTARTSLGMNRPDNATIWVDDTGTYHAAQHTLITTFVSTVGIGKLFVLGSEPAGWQNVGFADSGWASPVAETFGGPTPLPDGASRITATDGNVSVSAVFLFRFAFSLSAAQIVSAACTMLEDNTSTVWINGTQISDYFRGPTDTSGPLTTVFDAALLGTSNVLAVKIANYDAGSGANPFSLAFSLAITQVAAGTLDVQQDGALVGTRSAVNFIEGSNVTMTVADDPTDGRVNVTINAAGGGGGTVTSVGSSAPITSTGGPTPVVGLTTPLAGLYGGLGVDASGVTDGQIPIGGHSDHKFALGQIAAGSGIIVTNTDHGITVAASGTGGGGTALTQLAIVAVVTPVSSVSITGISGAFTSLWVHWIARSTTASTGWDNMLLRVNNLSTTIYDLVQSQFDSTYGGSNSFDQTSVNIGQILQDSLTASFWSMGDLLIPFYANTNTEKTVIARSSGDRHAGGATYRAFEQYGTIRTTAAITELDFIVGSNNFKAGTEFAIYGIA